jgi:hypothetical protein
LIKTTTKGKKITKGKKMPKQELHSMLQVGGSATAETVAVLTDSILQILATNAGDEVKKYAITALSTAFKVENVNISNCNFENK